MTSGAAETTYDAVSYQSNPYPQTHPDHLNMLARLFGMRPKPPERCRVLELGCGEGGNLLPMAAALPDSRFVGIDLSPRQIEVGQRNAERLGLENVELRRESILDFPGNAGSFDYIVCHGLFSWVPDVVRDRILAICRRHLSSQGVAFVSMNCLPGWSSRLMLRQMLLFHTQHLTDPAEKVEQARALADWLAKAVPEDASEYVVAVRAEAARMRKLADWYLFHDNLAEENRPFWFSEFAERFQAKGLQFLADTSFSTMYAGNFRPDVAETLQRLNGDVVRTEQYMDFLRARVFRQSLLVHDEVALERRLDWRAVEPFRFTSNAVPQPGYDLAPGVDATMRMADGLEITVDKPLVKAALLVLYEKRPRAWTIDELTEAAWERLGERGDFETDRVIVGKNLFSCFTRDAVLPRSALRAYATELGARPRASEWARLQAADGSKFATNLRHEGLAIDAFDRRLLPLVDGTRDRAALVEALLADVREGRLEVSRAPEGPGGEARPFRDEQELRGAVAEGVDIHLETYRRTALLWA